jgi:hypothetical protein
MAMFTRCSGCGCKGAVTALACVCGFAAVHPENLCLDARSLDRDARFCDRFVAHQVHDHHEPKEPKLTWVRTVSVSSVSSSSAPA